jgi:4-hydroxybenzoate polyprenyltransferase
MFATEAHEYLVERILKVRIGLLWLLLLAGALLAGGHPPAWLALAGALFVLAFRLWDDLADREYDRGSLPQRCLVRSEAVQSFRALLGFLLAALAGLVLVIAGGRRALAFLGLVAVFLAMYRITGDRPGLRPLRVVLVLAKYPAFVLLLAQRPGEPIALWAALGVFLPPLLDEVRGTGAGVLVPAAVFLGMAFLAWLGLTTWT